MRPIANIKRTLAVCSIAVLVAGAGCTIARVGPRTVNELEVAVNPAGSRIELNLARSTVHGELLEVTTEHLMMDTPDAIVIAPYEAVMSFKPAKMPTVDVRNRVPSDSILAAWLPLARFPAGIQPAHLAAMLAAHGQTEPRVVR